MKNNEYSPIGVTIISLCCSLMGSLTTNFGRIHTSRNVAGEAGIICIIFALVLPIFVKEFRKSFWNKKALLILLIAFIINLPFAVISIKNEYGI